MKNVIKKILSKMGYQITRINNKPLLDYSGVYHSPFGNLQIQLEEIKRRGFSSTSIWDIGANTTEWSRIAKVVFPDARFHLIEPQVEMEAHLNKFIADFPESYFTLKGVGAKEEMKVFTVWDDLAGSSLLPIRNEEYILSGKQREIQITTIDQMIEEKGFEIPDIIKLDIQGYELEALKGATSTFGKTELYFIEVSLFPFMNGIIKMPVFHEVIQFMYERGYVVYDFPFFLRRPYDGALGQCDVIFAKEDGFFRESVRWE